MRNKWDKIYIKPPTQWLAYKGIQDSFLIDKSNSFPINKANKQKKQMNHSPLKLNVIHSKIKEFIWGVGLTYLQTSAFLIFWTIKWCIQNAFKPHDAVRGAESSLSDLSQNNVLNVRIRNGNKEEKEEEHRDKENRSCWKGLFAYRNFQGEKSEVFVCYSFRIQTSFVIQLRNQIATCYIFR